MMRRIKTAALVAALLSAGCGDSESATSDTTNSDTVGSDVVDATADTGPPQDTATADTSDGDASDGDASDGDASDAPASDVVLTEPGTFVLGTADLPDESVFKGVWAGDAGRIVAVGNDGIVASRTAAKKWSVLARVEGAELLNATHGISADNLWAVGKNGTLLNGTADAFGESSACEVNADCNDFDTCTIDICVQGACTAQSSGLAGCCGSPVASWNFDTGTLAPWTVTQANGGITWQVSDRPGRQTSAPWSLYYGDPTKEPPDYDTGMLVQGTVESPTFTLPSTGTATLTFSTFVNTEPDASFDVFSIEIQSGPAWTQVWHKSELNGIPTIGFVTAQADLTPWRGTATKLRFRFDSIDSTFNTLEGVYVDDVRIDTACTTGGDAETQSGPTLWGVYALAADLAFAVGRAGTILQWDGALWSPAQGSDSTAVWNGLSGKDGTIALVGQGGRVAVAANGALRDVDAGVAVDLHSVHTADGQVFWAVGDKGTILRGEGDTWVEHDTPVVTSLRDVFAVSNTDVWAVGFLGSVFHYDGDTWGLVAVPAISNMLAVFVDGDGLVTMTGAAGTTLQGDLANGFTVVGDLHPTGDLVDIWGPEGSDQLFMVGSTGFIAHYDGTTWTEPPSTTGQGLQSVFGFGEDDVWAVGRAGTALHWDGTAWTRVETPVPASINAVWGDATNNVFAAGSGGLLMLWNGTEWISLATSTDSNLRAVFARAANDVWAVGAQATVMRFNGIGWAQTPVDMNEDGEEMTDELHAVWAAGPDDAWAVGAGGRMLRWDGSLWVRQENAFPETLRGLYGLAANDVWAVGNEGRILHFNGESWQAIASGSIATLHGIHGDGVKHVVVVGDIGTVLTLERD